MSPLFNAVSASYHYQITVQNYNKLLIYANKNDKKCMPESNSGAIDKVADGRR